MTRQEFARWIAHRLKPSIKPSMEALLPKDYNRIKEVYAKCIAMSMVKDEHAHIIAPGGYEIPALGEGNQARVPIEGCCG